LHNLNDNVLFIFIPSSFSLKSKRSVIFYLYLPAYLFSWVMVIPGQGNYPQWGEGYIIISLHVWWSATTHSAVSSETRRSPGSYSMLSVQRWRGQLWGNLHLTLGGNDLYT